MRRKVLAMTVLILAIAASTAPARGAGFGWVPDSAGLPPLVTLNEDDIGWIHVTRRLVAQENVPGRMLLGHGLFGLYHSVSGGGWASLTPGCLSPVRPPLIEDALGALSACGIEGLAADPHDPLRLTVSAYNLDLLAPGIPVNQGGVFTSRTGGLTWRKVLPGVRGNALAARRDSLLDPATLVAGRIQRTITDVGTDSNSFCRAVSRSDNCSPSVYVSTNDGTTWVPKYFEPAPCANAQNNVFTSSRIVGNIAFDPVDDNVVYAAANSGLWFSANDGNTWSNALAACGTNPGFAVTEGAGARRIYVGTFDGRLFLGTTNAAGPSGFAQMSLSGDRIDGQILSIMLDARDEEERTLFVASWTQPGNTGGGTGGVYKVQDNGNGTGSVRRLANSVLDFTRTFIPNQQALPYPLTVEPNWRPSLFLAQNPIVPDLIYASTVLGGVWVRSDG